MLPSEIEQEIKAVSTPQVKVVTPDGKPTSIDDYDSFMQFLMQAAATAQLVKLRKLEESKVPTGVKPIKMTIPDTVTKIQLHVPWISFSLINDGTNGITVWVNSEEDPLQEGMVAGSETYNCNMEYPVIRALYLKSESGTSNKVRIYGKVGKPQ